jgi:hypothetical protein
VVKVALGVQERPLLTSNQLNKLYSEFPELEHCGLALKCIYNTVHLSPEVRNQSYNLLLKHKNVLYTHNAAVLYAVHFFNPIPRIKIMNPIADSYLLSKILAAANPELEFNFKVTIVAAVLTGFITKEARDKMNVYFNMRKKDILELRAKYKVI